MLYSLISKFLHGVCNMLIYMIHRDKIENAQFNKESFSPYVLPFIISLFPT